jgi:hypothetical protein
MVSFKPVTFNVTTGPAAVLSSFLQAAASRVSIPAARRYIFFIVVLMVDELTKEKL